MERAVEKELAVVKKAAKREAKGTAMALKSLRKRVNPLYGEIESIGIAFQRVLHLWEERERM